MRCHLRPLDEPRQFAICGSIVRVGLLVSLMIVLGVGGVGCSSIYHQTQATLPPEPPRQLEFRIKEAQHTEQLARQSITKLRDQLNHGVSGTAIDPDVDRVTAAAFEFERRMASVQDAAAHCDGQTQLTSEIERLQGRSKELLEFVQTVRRAGNAINARLLDDLLQGPGKP